MDNHQTGRMVRDGAISMPPAAEIHLRAALEQMDLLLACQQEEVGLAHLVTMLKHLRALDRTMS